MGFVTFCVFVLERGQRNYLANPTASHTISLMQLPTKFVGLLWTLASCGRLGFQPNLRSDAGSVDSNDMYDGAVDAFIADAMLVDSAPTRANYAFVSQGQFVGNLGGVLGADALCQLEADTAGLVGQFAALLKADTRPDRSAPFATSRGWRLPSGRWVADTAAQLADGSFFQPVNELISGLPVPGGGASRRIWSGEFGGQDCDDWTNENTIGDQTFLPQWRRMSDGSFSCSEMFRLYCFEYGRSVPYVPNPIVEKLVFLSLGKFTPNPLSTADQMCQSEATTAGLPGTFIALLPTNGMAALDRLPNGSATVFQRVDGVEVGRLGDVATQLTYITHAADGTSPPESGVWTGGNPAIPQANTCSDWVATTGSAETSAAYDWPGFRGNTAPCSAAFRLYCAQL